MFSLTTTYPSNSPHASQSGNLHIKSTIEIFGVTNNKTGLSGRQHYTEEFNDTKLNKVHELEKFYNSPTEL